MSACTGQVYAVPAAYDLERHLRRKQMGRPLSKQQLFGANANNNIKVQFHNGTSSVRGYILEQTGSKRFKCIDESGNTAVCYLKDKAAGALAAGEMTITFKYDDLTVQQALKISRHRISLMYNGTLQSFPWNFSTSTTDGYWQVEEAGNAVMAGATNLEGDEDGNADYPVPGSGTFQTKTVALSGVTYSLKGTAAAVTGGIDTVANSASGLIRAKYAGHFNDALGGLPAAWTMNFFSTRTPIKRIADTYVSWGNQTDTTAQENFSMEFKGYIQVPVTDTYNFYAAVDDDCAIWIGNNALEGAPTNANYDMQGSNKSMPGSTIVNTNSRTMTASKWYPIRIWMTEYTGGSKFQLFAISSANVKYAGTDLAFAYNTATNGYNP